MPRIALIHATPLAIEPVQASFARDWPQCALVNILDDTLSRDAARKAGDETARRALRTGLAARICALSRYAVSTGADGILYTCSAFGEAIETAASLVNLPVLKPNEAMLEEALDDSLAVLPSQGARRVGLIASFEATLPSMTAELRALARARGVQVEVRPALAEGAMEALGRGDAAAHDAMLADAARSLHDCDVLLLAQFSTARARDAVAAAMPQPVLTSPDSAVRKMRRLLES